jgi:energy-coupling factor transporter ATP-binding protein EcfA2
MELIGVQLDRFKVFEHATFEIAPLTVLIGPNNAGKSSLLQALALLCQSATETDPIVSSGDLVDLGDDVSGLAHFDSRREEGEGGWAIKIRWQDSTSVQHNAGTLSAIVSFLAQPGPTARARTESEVQLSGPRIRQFTLKTHYPGSNEAQTLFEPIDTEMEHGRRRVVMAHVGAWSAIYQNLHTHVPPTEQVQEEPLEFAVFDTAIPLLEGIPEALRSFRYIGPNRTVECSTYPLGNVGSTNPRTAQEVLDTLAYDASLRRAISHRCEQVFGFGLDIELLPGQRVALVAVGQEEQRVNAINVGSGLVQLIWIVLQLELALQYKASTEIKIRPTVGIEEPEVHLHPAKQPDMARILVDYARRGPRIICTTQSEHLLMAILQMVLEGVLSPDDLAVYYIEAGQADRLAVDEQGRLSEGLRGFFEANEEELLDRLQALIDRG